MKTDILNELRDASIQRVAEKQNRISRQSMERLGLEHSRSDGFVFEQILKQPQMTFICECKKASPSKGVIAPEFPYLEIAEDYEAGGAGAISVLTEPTRFLGRDAYLWEIAEAVSVPVLRKDFIVDAYLIYEAAYLGASIVLLIAGILQSDQLKEYLETAESLGLSAVVEVHDEQEIQMAVDAGARIIGVNNRNLHDFTVDLSTSTKLRARIPEQILMIAESGIRTRRDIEQLEQGGVNGVLIGETLMRAEDRIGLLKELKGEKR